MQVAILGFPEGERCAPVALTADAPVHVILEPLAKATIFDMFWIPVDFLVLSCQVFTHFMRANKPAWTGKVQDWVARAVMKRIRVQDLPRVVHHAAFFHDAD